jgi:uncharacterized protein YkwD
LDAVNAERSLRHVAPVAASETLEQIAEYHISRMIDGNYFGHDDPFDRSTVGARAAKFDYPYQKIGENLAAGQDAAGQVLAGWLASPAHRAILLDPEFREAGVAVLDGGRYGRYWAIELGTRVGQP